MNKIFEDRQLAKAIYLRQMSAMKGVLNYGEIKFGVGREASKQYLQDNPKIIDELRAKVLAVAKERQIEDDAGTKPAPVADEPAEEKAE